MLKTVGNPSTRYGDQTIIDGNLVIGTSDKGVDFSSSSHAPGMSSELLNDYEEGIWTPTLTTSNGDFAGITYNAITGGRYVKIGTLVHVQATIQTDSVDKTGATGVIRIGGLPFNVVASSGATYDGFGAISIGQVVDWQSINPSSGWIIANTDKIQLGYRATSDSAIQNLTPTHVATGAGYNFITFTGTYIAA